MANAVIPAKAKLFIGVLFSDNVLIQKCKETLEKKYGEIDLVSDKISFSNTNYYKSIGNDIYKVFFSFKKHMDRSKISKIKLFTNKLELKLSNSNKRKINIDPGYLTLSNVYLASCKEFFHRAYISKGVYLENEYKFVGGSFEPWPWTYPDYQKQEYYDFFEKLRKIYHNELKKK